MPEIIANLDNPRLRAKIVNAINQKRGKWRISVTQYRPRRSDRQNRYYWPCFVQPFAQFLREQGQHTTDLEAHEILKHKFLRKTVNPNDPIDITQSTTQLNTTEFNQYLDQCAQYLAEMFNIIVPEPNEYHEID